MVLDILGVFGDPEVGEIGQNDPFFRLSHIIAYIQLYRNRIGCVCQINATYPCRKSKSICGSGFKIKIQGDKKYDGKSVSSNLELSVYR